MPMEPRKVYVRPQGPQLKVIGSVADLTQTGLTTPGTDGKGGSVLSPGG